MGDKYLIITNTITINMARTLFKNANEAYAYQLNRILH